MAKLNLKDYVRKNEETGELEFDEQAFNSALDRERTSASQTARERAEKELREKIKQELAEEAKLSAEEKLKKDYEAKEKELLDRAIALNKREVRAIYKGAGFTDSEIEALIDIVTDDAESIEKATKLAEARKKANEDLKAKYEKEIGVKTPAPNGQSPEGEESEGAKYAKKLSEQNKNQEVKL